MKEAIAVIETSKDGTYTITTPILKYNIWGKGQTMDFAKKAFETSYEELKESCLKDYGQLPEDLKDLIFEYKDQARVSNAIINTGTILQKGKKKYLVINWVIKGIPFTKEFRLIRLYKKYSPLLKIQKKVYGKDIEQYWIDQY
jgi:hypothetical protein